MSDTSLGPWHDVYYRLPKYSGSYLVIELFRSRGEVKRVVRFCYFDVEKGQFERTPKGQRCITHWMSCPPKPPLIWREEYDAI